MAIMHLEDIREFGQHHNVKRPAFGVESRQVEVCIWVQILRMVQNFLGIEPAEVVTGELLRIEVLREFTYWLRNNGM